MTSSMEQTRKVVLEALWPAAFDEFERRGYIFRWAHPVTPRRRKTKWLLVCYPDGKIDFCKERWDPYQRRTEYNILGVWQTEGDLRTPGPEAPPLPADSIKPNRASAESKAVVRVSVAESKAVVRRVPVVEQQDLIMNVIREKADRDNGVWFAPMSTLEALTGLSETQVKDRVSELKRSGRLMVVGRRGKGTTFIVR